MSRTNKTRPFEVAYRDPHNRRFRMVGNDGTENWTWKPLTSCSSSKCCWKWWQDNEKKRRKLQARKELRNILID